MRDQLMAEMRAVQDMLLNYKLLPGVHRHSMVGLLKRLIVLLPIDRPSSKSLSSKLKLCSAGTITTPNKDTVASIDDPNESTSLFVKQIKQLIFENDFNDL